MKYQGKITDPKDLVTKEYVDIGLSGKLGTSGDGSNVTAAFTAASSRTNISSGEKLSVIFGKVAKWFSDLGTAAFRGVDAAPTANSTNLVESGGVKSALTQVVMKCSTAFAIPAVNSPVTKSMAGLTADHELVRWNFADSGTPVAENAPPVDLTWTTAAGQFTITTTGGTTTYTIQPVFALPSAIAIT